jgi:two-component system, OmpR family, sensor histidine kinase KdpD
MKTVLASANESRSAYRSALVTILCLAGVFGCTFLSFRLGQNLGSAGFLYLVFVVLAAVYGGFWQATLVSIVSVASLDYFFNPPVFSFSVDRLSNWVELGAFEFTALVVSRLSTRSQLRALEAIRERRHTTRLYETARRILLIDGCSDTGNLVASLVRSEFDLNGVVLFDALQVAICESGEPVPGVERHLLVKRAQAAYFSDLDTYDGAEKTWFCVLRLGVRPVGALALCGTEMSELNARALASLCAIALERARALDRQYHAEAEREAEKLRAAVLDALAHQFKTPLTVIRTAAAGIPASGELSQLQAELISLIDHEAQRLNQLAHRLVGASDLGSTRVEPQPEPLLLSRLMKTVIDELDQQVERDRFRLSLPAHEPPVFGDRELLFTALNQLVDNALKYSVADSLVDVGVAVKESGIILTVRSRGLVVAGEDRERIFERFYRAPGAQSHATGTGLGLSIVRTIAADHNGHVWAEGEPGYGTTFSLSLPMPDKVLT